MSGPEEQRVPAYVALVRIAAVIGMSAFLAFGIFALIATAWLIGLVSLVLAAPFYLLMRYVEGRVDYPEDA